MVSTKKAAVAVVAMLALSAVGVVGITAVLDGGSETVPGQQESDIPDQEQYNSSAAPSDQLSAVMSKLYHVDHSQEVSAELKTSGSNDALRTVDSVTLVSHSSEQLFSGVQVEKSDGSTEVSYQYVSADVGGVAEGAPGQALSQPPSSGWETTDARYQADSPVPSLNESAEWSVKSENNSRVVLAVTGESDYVAATNSSAFDELTSETYMEVHIDKENGRVVKIVDYQVGMNEEEDGSVRGPFVLERVVTFEYESVSIETPDGLAG